MIKTKKIIAAVLVIALVFSCGIGLFGSTALAVQEGMWVTTWGSSLVNGSISLGALNFSDIILAGSTLRTELPVTNDSNRLRFVFSNQYGASDVVIDEASVAKTNGNGRADIIDGTQHPITFNSGETAVTIPAGGSVTSDYVDIKTTALEYISVSLYFSNLTYMTSVGLSNGRTFMKRSLLDSSSQVNSTYLLGAGEVNISSGQITYHTIPFLERIDSYATPNTCAAVFIGDSTLVNNTYLHYAERLKSAGVNNVSIINEAVIGNKLLSDGSGVIGNLYGQALLDRFKRDVLNIRGVKYCFVKIGLNDVLHQYSKTLAASTPKHSAEDIIAGYRSLITQCHNKGIKIYFFTKSAWKGYERNFLGSGVDIEWTQEEQNICDKLTEWVKNNKEADGYIDCSPLADPSDPVALCPSLTLDGAHLSELGSIALADLIPLQYVGVTTEGKTAAQLAGVDPYAEKNQIIANMSATESTTADSAPDTTAAPETTAGAPENTTAAEPPSSDNSPEPYTVFELETEPEEETEVYEIPTVDPQNQPSAPNQDVNYVVTDDDTPVSGSIGSGGNVGFIMAFGLVAVIAVTMGVLTLTKKKES